MTGKNIANSNFSGRTFLNSAASADIANQGEAKNHTGGKPVSDVDQLLQAFSDTAYAPEFEDHSWESWNYSRISTF